MSVNEVKLKMAAVPFAVKGTGPPTSRTFAIGDEDHTLGNAARHILMQDERVSFAGYSVPHPSEPIVHIRVQTKVSSGCPAVEAFKDSLQTLHSQCDLVLEKLEEVLPEVREDRLLSEKLLMEDAAFFQDEDAMEDEEEEDDDAGDPDEDGDADIIEEDADMEE